ncbi:hypothetical protein J4423_02925 [Candidatus Pacearchaeota archaeon]|nr:hypothetical protein [Candidatus Pacearchaeota archaeon]
MSKKRWRFLSVFFFILLLILLITLQVRANLTSSYFIAEEGSFVSEFSSEFNVAEAVAPSHGSGGGIIAVTQIDLTEQELNYVDAKPSRLQFEFNGRFYAVQLKRIRQDKAEFIIINLDSDNLNDVTFNDVKSSFELELGKREEIDINEDGVDDMVINLNRINSPFSVDGTRIREGIRTADFSIKRIGSR